MTENERIKLIRTSLDMTLEKFGQRLGVTKVAISNIENGNRKVTDQMRKAICREYNVNETWLRTGEEEMFVALPEEDEVADMVYDLLSDNKNSFHELIIEIMRTYKELSPGSQEVINEYVSKLLANMAQKKGD